MLMQPWQNCMVEIISHYNRCTVAVDIDNHMVHSFLQCRMNTAVTSLIDVLIKLETSAANRTKKG